MVRWGSWILFLKEHWIRTFSYNKVSNAACALLVKLKILCIRLHCQKGFNLIVFSHKIRSVLDLISEQDIICPAH